MYSEKVMKHFRNPKHMGTPKQYDVVGKVGNPVCGDVMHIYLKIRDEKITDIDFKTMGCAAAIATSSITCEIASGKTLDEALKITKKDVVDALDGLPENKIHCSNLAVDALHKAVKEYRK
ncbi:MAG: iron-sulfur cluster assembly scaffold protein [Candidatus Altiarchaeales archaeon]|nr:iron-sulfur cluster assembly scaffold protein [Candidatus Altiarchaeales archaeon]